MYMYMHVGPHTYNTTQVYYSAMSLSSACGQAHSVFLLNDGSLLSSGSNEFGQLGHEKGNTRPGRVYIDCSYAYCTEACHSIIHVYTWLFVECS